MSVMSKGKPKGRGRCSQIVMQWKLRHKDVAKNADYPWQRRWVSVTSQHWDMSASPTALLGVSTGSKAATTTSFKLQP